MIRSMTAFVRLNTQGDWGMAAWELRSTNHRHLEISLRLPEILNDLEPGLRQQLRDLIQRGKIEISLHYQPNASATQITINQNLAMQLLSARQTLANLAQTSTPLDPTDLLNWPHILQTVDTKPQNLQTELQESFHTAILKLIALRETEGEAIKNYLKERLSVIQTEINKVKNYLPTLLQHQREKILARFEEAKLALDSNRLEQEMVLFIQKIDISEELNRLETHLTAIDTTLQQTGANGRRLDFLLQELHREANTMGAKSVAAPTSAAAIELKVLIEQMREQVQNVE